MTIRKIVAFTLCIANTPLFGVQPGLYTKNNSPALDFTAYITQVRITGAFAEVTTLMCGHNCGKKTLVGHAQLALPAHASIQRLACGEMGNLVELNPAITGVCTNGLWRMPFLLPTGKAERLWRLTYITKIAEDANTAMRLLRLPLPREQIGEFALTIRIDKNRSKPTLEGLTDTQGSLRETSTDWRTTFFTRAFVPQSDIEIRLPQSEKAQVAFEKYGSNVWFCVDMQAPQAAPRKRVLSADAFRILWDGSAKRHPDDLKRMQSVINILPRKTYYSLIVYREKPESERFFSSNAELLNALDHVEYRGESNLQALAQEVRALTTGERITTLLFSNTIHAKDDLDFGNSHILGLTTHKGISNKPLLSACRGRVLDLETTSLESVAEEILHPVPRLTDAFGEGIEAVQGLGAAARGRICLIGKMTQEKSTLHLQFGRRETTLEIPLAATQAPSGSLLYEAHRVWLDDPFRQN